MTDLIATLTGLVAAAFSAEGLDPALGVVTRADRPDLADFQCNGALKASKAVGKNPREIAAAVATHLTDPVFAQIEVAGPGFINIKVAVDALSKRAATIAGDERAGAEPVAAPRNVVIDFGGPNIAKPMHVGHLRSSIIGDSLQRLFRYMGDHVTSDIHMGDWGLPMGMLICQLRLEQPQLEFFKDDYSYTAGKTLDQLREDAAFLATCPVTLDDLERMYPLAAAACKADETRAEEARQITAAMQQGRHQGYRALWCHFRLVTEEALRREFQALGLKDFTVWLGESDTDEKRYTISGMSERQSIATLMVADLMDSGIAVQDDGAVVIRVSEQDEEPPLPPLILVKRDGGILYGTTDLATIAQRNVDFKPALVLYVVDARQSDHFKQVFRASDIIFNSPVNVGDYSPLQSGSVRERSGAQKPPMLPASALEHIGFGTMNGVDGKPFKTRAGGVMKLKDLIDQAVDKARARLREAGMGKELAEAEFEEVAHKVAIAAIKFADLHNWRGANYVFDLDRFMTFEGKTGPYLLYQAVRAKAILRKAGQGAFGPITVTEPAERDLVLLLDSFNAALHGAYDKRAPHLIAEHGYALAQTFSKFYAACPILAPGHEATRASRLGLTAAMLKQLEIGLGLLGMDAPERM